MVCDSTGFLKTEFWCFAQRGHPEKTLETFQNDNKEKKEGRVIVRLCHVKSKYLAGTIVVNFSVSIKCDTAFSVNSPPVL